MALQSANKSTTIVQTCLARVVDIFLALNGSHARLLQRVDLVKPFHAPCANVSSDDDTQRESMDFGQRLAVHLPGEKDLLGIRFDFAIRNRHCVVKDILLPAGKNRERWASRKEKSVILEVCLGTDEFNVFAFGEDTSSGVLEDLLEGYSSIHSSAADNP